MNVTNKLAGLLRPNDVEPDLAAPNKSRLLKLLAQKAGAATGLDEGMILAALQVREDLGSTGIGNGIAIPHASMSGLAAPFSIFARLAQPVDFDAIDARGVDIVFLLLLPHENRSADLNALSSIARQLRSPTVQAALRAATTPAGLYAALTTLEP
jgi:PTS system nitrogen regulatory IIA component